MEKFNEQWQKTYRTYLLEEMEHTDVDDLLTELAFRHTDLTNKLLTMQALCEDAPLVLDMDQAAKMLGQIADDGVSASANINVSINKPGKEVISGTGYAPAKDSEYTTIKDMSFPKNVIFFVKQILVWIKNIVVYFIEKFRNVIKRLLKEPETVLDPNSLKLTFRQLKKDTANKPVTAEDKKTIERYTNLDPSIKERITDWWVAQDALAPTPTLKEGFLGNILGSAKEAKKDLGSYEKNRKNNIVVMNVDISKDMDGIRALFVNFMQLFDNAYGSRDEKLFDTEDLKQILQLFQNTLKRIQDADIYTNSGIMGKGYTPGAATAGRAGFEDGLLVEYDGLSVEKVKNNLISTSKNINNLRAAYQETAAKIVSLGKIIGSKELMLLSNRGINCNFLSDATVKALESMSDQCKGRLRQCKRLERALAAYQRKFSDLTEQLHMLQSQVSNIGSITYYDKRYDKFISNLYAASKYMTDITTLRLTGLALYIKELKNLKAVFNIISTKSKATGAEY